MADTYTTFLSLTRPEVGASRDAWGDKWNENATKLDNWAAGVDKLAKDALSREILTAQTVKGPVTFSQSAEFSNGLSAPVGQTLRAGKAQFSDGTDFTLIRAVKNFLWVNREDGTAPVFRVNETEAYIGFARVWHAANFNPPDYANKIVNTTQSFAGPLEINRNTPYLDLVLPNVIRRRAIIDGIGTLIDRNGDTGENYFYFTTGGQLWTKQFGDLNDRIEARANTYASDRANSALATARNEYANRLVKTGDTMTGALSMSWADPTINFFNTQGAIQKLVLSREGHIVIRDGADVDNFRFQHLGALWTRQFGDLNTRIENRAAAFANDALGNARAYTDQSFSNFRNTYNEFYQDQRIGKANPELQLLWGGVARWGIKVNEDAALYFRRPDDNALMVAFHYGNGAIFSAQFGDLNNRIENRAAAFADDRLTAARNEFNRIAVRLAYAGDLGPDWNLNNANFSEPYPGAVITTRNTNNPGGPIYWTGARWRYVQMRGTDGNWYTVSYV